MLAFVLDVSSRTINLSPLANLVTLFPSEEFVSFTTLTYLQTFIFSSASNLKNTQNSYFTTPSGVVLNRKLLKLVARLIKEVIRVLKVESF